MIKAYQFLITFFHFSTEAVAKKCQSSVLNPLTCMTRTSRQQQMHRQKKINVDMPKATCCYLVKVVTWLMSMAKSSVLAWCNGWEKT